jgi:muconolactone delta-isomerase
MEYLVTMTTRVPQGTSDDAVEDIRAREAARACELAAEGHLLRLWRPPVRPGEWRTLGLFAADDQAELGQLLASMPLHVWRTDEITPLSHHNNDPDGHAPSPNGVGPKSTEFFTTFTLTIPVDAPDEVVDEAEAGEARRTRELAAEGHLLRLWHLPGEGRSLGLWRATGPPEMEDMLLSLPLASWLKVVTLPLNRHPSDPGS